MCKVPWGCSVPWRVFSTVGEYHKYRERYLEYRVGVQYRGGYHDKYGGYHEYCGGILSTMGDTQDCGGYHYARGGYHEYHGSVQYWGESFVI